MSNVEARTHHVRSELCQTRPPYREGRKSSAVKVYTVHHESRYLLVQGVPAVGAGNELDKLFSTYGQISEICPLDDYPADQFSEVYLVKFERIQSARFAKRKLDDYSLFGGVLHVCYAPEFETVQDTREKLQDRRRVMAARIRKLENEGERTKTEQQPSAAKSDLHKSHSQHLRIMPPPPLQPSVTPNQPALPHIVTNQPPRPLQPLSLPPGNPSSADESAELGDAQETFTKEMLQLPPPPVLSFHPAHRHHQFDQSKRKEFEFAWVPTANATFPLGYDPRLPPPPPPIEDRVRSGVVDQSPDPNNSVVSQDLMLSLPNTVNLHVHTATGAVNKGVKASVVSSVTSGHSTNNIPGKTWTDKPIVKDYKPKGPSPRFVPRQIQAKADGDKSVNKKSCNSMAVDDELNRAIRKEAFRLAEEQGAELPTDPEVREELLGQRPIVEPRVEASVVKTVRDIRKRLSKFISEMVPKKAKKEKTSLEPTPAPDES